MAHLWKPLMAAAVAVAAVCLFVEAALAALPSETAAGERSALRAGVDQALHGIATVIEVTGVAIIVIAALIASVLFLVRGFRSSGWSEAYRGYRANLGRGILLGLELLVTPDIIGTVAVTPSFQSLGVLALIVLIRTFLSFSLEVEIEGRWPWRRHAAEPGRSGGERP